MTKKGDRIVARRILHVLDLNLGVGMRFSEISKTLAEHHWHHGQFPLSDNLKYLIAQGKVAHIGDQYSLIQTRKNGTKFVIVKNPVKTVVELEK